MDNFRRSNVSLSQLNASQQESPGRAPSVYESRTRFEAAQVDLLRYLKWVVALIGVIVVLLALKALAGDAAAQRCAAPVAGAKSRLRDYFAASAPAPAPAAPAAQARPAAAATAEGFWSYFLPNWGYSELGAVEERLRKQYYSVKPVLPELPSLEAIRAQPERFNLSLAELAETSAERLRALFPPEAVRTGLQGLVGGEPGAEAAPEEVERRRAQLLAQLGQLDALGKQLRQNTTAELLLKLHDLRGSGRTLIAKRNQLNELRGRFLAAERSLGACEARERGQDAALDGDRRLAEELRQRVAALEAEAAELRQRIEEKEKSLTESDRANRERILALTDRAAQLKANLARKPAIEQAVEERRRRAAQLTAELERLRARFADLSAQRAAADEEFQRFMVQPRQLQDELLRLEASREILAMRLNSLRTHRQIKNFLGSLLPAKEKKSTLESIIDDKLSEEKELLEVVAKYEREGRVGSGSPEQLKEQIQRDESSFQTILQKYAEWQQVVEEYGASDQDVSGTQQQVREVDAAIRTLQQRLGEFKGRETALTERLLGFDKALSATRTAVAAAEAEGAAAADWAARAAQELLDWQGAWTALQQEIAAKNSEFVAYKANVEQSFAELDRQREALNAALEVQRAQLREVAARLKAEGERLTTVRADCTAVKALYVKTAELLPALQALIAHDVRVVAQLKAELAALVEPYTLAA